MSILSDHAGQHDNSMLNTMYLCLKQNNKKRNHSQHMVILSCPHLWIILVINGVGIGYIFYRLSIHRRVVERNFR